MPDLDEALPLELVALLIEDSQGFTKSDHELWLLSRLMHPLDINELSEDGIGLVDAIPKAKRVILTEQTRIVTMASEYKVTILVDMSSSTRILDSQDHTPLSLTIVETLRKCLKGLAQPCQIPTLNCRRTLKINVSVVAMFCSSTSDPTYRVVVHNHCLTQENAPDLIKSVLKMLDQYENDVAQLAHSKEDDGAERAETAGALRILELVNDTMTSPYAPAMIWITDSVTRSNDLDTMTEIRKILANNVALTIVQGGSSLGFTPGVSFSHIPNNEILRFVTLACDGRFLYASDCPEDVEASPLVLNSQLSLNFYHRHFLSREKRLFKLTPDQRYGQVSSIIGASRPADTPQSKLVHSAVTSKAGMIRDFGQPDQRYPWDLESVPPASCEVLCHYRDYTVSAPVSQLVAARLRSGFSVQRISVHASSKPDKPDRVELVLISHFYRNVNIQYHIKYPIVPGSDILSIAPRRVPKIQVNILAHQMFALLFMAVPQIEFIHEPVEDLNASHNLDKTLQGSSEFHKKLIELHQFLRNTKEMDENLKTVKAFSTRLPSSTQDPAADAQTNYWQYLGQILLADSGMPLLDTFSVHIVLRTTSASLVLPNFEITDNDNSQRGKRSVALSFLAQFLRDKWSTMVISNQVYLKTVGEGFFLTKLHWESDCLVRLEVLCYNVPHAMRLKEYEDMHNQINDLEHLATATRLNNLKRSVFPLLATKQKLSSLVVHYSRKLDQSENALVKSHARTNLDPLLRSYLLRWRWYYHIPDAETIQNLDNVKALAIRELTYNRLSEGYVIVAESHQGISLFREIYLPDNRTTTVQCAILHAEDGLAVVDVWLEPGLDVIVYDEVQITISKHDQATLAYFSTYFRLQSNLPLDLTSLHQAQALEWHQSPYQRPLLNSPWLWTTCILPFGLNVLSRKSPVMIATFPTAKTLDQKMHRYETEVIFETLRTFLEQNSQGCITDYLKHHDEVYRLWSGVTEKLNAINRQHGRNFVGFQSDDMDTFIIKLENQRLYLVSAPMGNLGQDGYENFAIVIVELPVPEVGVVPARDFRNLENYEEESPREEEEQFQIMPMDEDVVHGIVLTRTSDTPQTAKRKEETIQGLKTILDKVSLGYKQSFVSSMCLRLLMNQPITQKEQDAIIKYCRLISRFVVDVMPWVEARKANQGQLSPSSFKEALDQELKPFMNPFQGENLLNRDKWEWFGLNADDPSTHEVERLIQAAQHPVIVRLHFQAGNNDVTFEEFCRVMDSSSLLHVHLMFWAPFGNREGLLPYQKEFMDLAQHRLTSVVRAFAVQECVLCEDRPEDYLPTVPNLEIALHQLIINNDESKFDQHYSAHIAIPTPWVDKSAYPLFVDVLKEELQDWNMVGDYHLRWKPHGFDVVVLHEDCVDLVHFNSNKDEANLDDLAKVVKDIAADCNRIVLLEAMHKSKEWDDAVLSYDLDTKRIEVPAKDVNSETVNQRLMDTFASHQLVPKKTYLIMDDSNKFYGHSFGSLVTFDVKDGVVGIEVSSHPTPSDALLQRLKADVNSVMDSLTAEKTISRMVDGALPNDLVSIVLASGSGTSRHQTIASMDLICPISMTLVQELLYLARFHAQHLSFQELEVNGAQLFEEKTLPQLGIQDNHCPVLMLHHKTDRVVSVVLLTIVTQEAEQFSLDKMSRMVEVLTDLQLEPIKKPISPNSFVVHVFSLGSDCSNVQQDEINLLNRALQLAQTDLLLDQVFQSFRTINGPSSLLEPTATLLEHAAKLQHSVVQEVSCQVNLSPSQLNDFVIELHDQMDELEPDLKLVVLGNEAKKKTTFCDMAVLQQRSFAAFPRVPQPTDVGTNAYLVEPSLFCVAVGSKVIAWTHGCNKATAESIMSSIVKILSWHSLRTLFGTTDASSNRFPATRTLAQSKLSSSLHTVSTLDLHTLDKTAGGAQGKTNPEAFGDDVLQRQCAEVIANYIKSQSISEALSGVVQAINSVRVLITVNEPLLFVCPHLRESVLGIPPDVEVKELVFDQAVQSWMQDLCHSLVSRYSSYLESLGFEKLTIDESMIQSDDPKFAMCESKSVTTTPSYLVYNSKSEDKIDGRILAQVGVQGTFLCVNWFTIRDPGAPSSRCFTDECLRLKGLAHVQSFMYDWHLSVFYSATNPTSRNASSLVPLHFLDLLRSFLTINPKRARFARDAIIQDQFGNGEQGIPCLQRLAKSSTTGLRPIYYEGTLIAICFVSSRSDFGLDMEDADPNHDHNFALVVDVRRPTPAITYYLLAVDNQSRFPYAVDPPFANVKSDVAQSLTKSSSGDKSASLRTRLSRVNSLAYTGSSLAQSLSRRDSRDLTVRFSNVVSTGDVLRSAREKIEQLIVLGTTMQRDDSLWKEFASGQNVDEQMWTTTFLEGKGVRIVDMDPRLTPLFDLLDGKRLLTFLQSVYKGRMLPSGEFVMFDKQSSDQVLVMKPGWDMILIQRGLADGEAFVQDVVNVVLSWMQFL